MRVLALLFTLVGCAHVGHRGFTGPDGQTSYEAYCNGSNVSFADCMNEAAETCGGLYQVLDKSSHREHDGVAEGMNKMFGAGADAANSTHSDKSIFVEKRVVTFRCH